MYVGDAAESSTGYLTWSTRISTGEACCLRIVPLRSLLLRRCLKPLLLIGARLGWGDAAWREAVWRAFEPFEDCPRSAGSEVERGIAAAVVVRLAAVLVRQGSSLAFRHKPPTATTRSRLSGCREGARDAAPVRGGDTEVK